MLQWTTQVMSTISKAKKALNAISLIKKYFNQEELLELVTANYYSKLYYNSEVWQIPTLHKSLKNKLLTASSRALQLCSKPNDMSLISYQDLHNISGRATPNRLARYKLALQLYKTISYQGHESEAMIKVACYLSGGL